MECGLRPQLVKGKVCVSVCQGRWGVLKGRGAGGGGPGVDGLQDFQRDDWNN